MVAGLGVPLFTIPQSNPLPASLAAGLALTAAMLAFGYLSGGHFNPAVTVGNAIAGRIRLADAAAYIGAQLVGAAARRRRAVRRPAHRPRRSATAGPPSTPSPPDSASTPIIQVPMAGVLLVEVLGAALLVAVYLGTTVRPESRQGSGTVRRRPDHGVLLQLGQAVGNAPVQPGPRHGVGHLQQPGSLGQLWLFWVAPLVGAALAGLVFRGFAQTAARPTVQACRSDGLSPEPARTTAEPGRARTTTSRAPMRPRRRRPAATAPRRRPARAGGDEARDFFDSASASEVATRPSRPPDGRAHLAAVVAQNCRWQPIP